MKLSDQEKRFILKNKQTLKAIAEKRIKDLKDEIVYQELDDSKRNSMILMIREYQNLWLPLLNRIGDKKKDKDKFPNI